MENDLQSPDPSSKAARETLATLAEDDARLAELVVTPWWYHPALALVVAVLVGAQSLPQPWSITLVALGIAALPVITAVYRRRYGVSVTEPVGPRTRRLFWALLSVLAAAMLAALVVQLAGASPWWGLLLAAAAFGLTLVLGLRYDAALRAELRRQHGDRS